MEQHSRIDRKNEHANFSYFFLWIMRDELHCEHHPAMPATLSAQTNGFTDTALNLKGTFCWAVDVKRNWKIYLSFHLKVIWFFCSSYFIYANFHPPLTIFRVYSLHFPHIIVSYIHVYIYIFFLMPNVTTGQGNWSSHIIHLLNERISFKTFWVHIYETQQQNIIFCVS